MFCSRKLAVFCLFFLIIFSKKSFSFEEAWNSFSDLNFSKNEKELFINNKILFRFKNNTITIMDVIHKMNLLFYKSYPHLIHSNISKMQFYSGLFPVLAEAVIDDFLIVADAEEKKISVDIRDVKREIEKFFGDALIDVTNAFNMTEEDVFKIIQRDLIVQKMLGVMVRSRATMFVSPNKIKEAYKEKLKNYKQEKFWSYVILTLDSASVDSTLTFAEEIYDKIISNGFFKEEEILQLASEKNIEIKISNLLQGTENSLSQMHRGILIAADSNLCSKPISYKKDKIRLFVIKEFSITKEKSFSELEEQLHSELLEKLFEKQELIYREKLREKYSFHKDILIKDFTSNESISSLFSWLSE